MAFPQQLVRYFDLGSGVRSSQRSGGAKAPRIRVVPQYVAMLLGILVEPVFDNYRRTGTWTLGSFTGWLPAAVVVSLVIFPGVYRTVWDPRKPMFVQLCSIFVAGIGWKAALSTAGAAAGHHN